MRQNFSKDIFEDDKVPNRGLKSMMINNDNYDDSNSSKFDFLFISIIVVSLIILFLIFYI
ncbi:hypothetical protein HYI43_09800 [Staphylococcus taiwanensis]|nr:hypothetical protein HYI43_09800 [Staphylococcus taiwanensis]